MCGHKAPNSPSQVLFSFLPVRTHREKLQEQKGRMVKRDWSSGRERTRGEVAGRMPSWSQPKQQGSPGTHQGAQLPPWAAKPEG